MQEVSGNPPGKLLASLLMVVNSCKHNNANCHSHLPAMPYHAMPTCVLHTHWQGGRARRQCINCHHAVITCPPITYLPELLLTEF
jgi:hypothetical protein